MKKQVLTAATIAGLSIAAFAQKFFEPVTFTGAFPVSGTSLDAKIEGTSEIFNFSDGNWTTGWTEWYPNSVAYAAPTTMLEGDVTSDRSIPANAIVELKGTVHVTNGATLTIGEGAKIRAGIGATLIIAQGSKINAVGTKTNPIVFTSAKPVGQRTPGDWAGILLIGKSQVNTTDGTRQYEALPNDNLARYGGGRGANLNLADNSGEMRFVRIEYAGYNYLPDQELNGLTLGAVGSGTRINFIQVSYARDDSFEWFGGTSRHKYLVAYSGVDDDFDMDEGFAGQAQFILGVRNPNVFETAAGGTSNGFEHDNNTGMGSASAVVPGNNNPEPNTKPLISNATMIGPWVVRTPTTGNKFGRGMEMRSAVATSVYNSIVIGYNTGVQLVHPSTTITPSVQERLRTGQSEYTNVHFVLNNTINGVAFTSSTNPPAGEYSTANFNTYLTNRGGTNSLYTPANQIFSTIITNFGSGATAGTASPSYMIQSTSPIAGVVASFTGIIAPFVGDVTLNPSLLVNKNSVNFPTRLNNQTSQAVSITVTAANLTASGITIGSNNASFVVSVPSITSTGGSFTVNYVSTVGGAATGVVTVVSQGLVQSIQVTGNVVAPAQAFVAANIATLSFESTANVAPFTSTGSKMFVVSGRELTSAVTVMGTSNFMVSLDNSTFAQSVVITPTAGTGVLALTTVTVKMMSNEAGSISENIMIMATGATTKMVAAKANLAPVLVFIQSGNVVAAPGLTVDYFTGQVISSTSANMIVSGTKLPASGLTISVLNGGALELSTSTTFFPGTTSITLPVVDGVITATSSNLYVRYVSTIAGFSNIQRGLQVGEISVSGFSASIAVNIRLNSPTTVTGNRPALPTTLGYILASNTSNVVTALGFAPNAVLRSTPWIYSAVNDAAIGRVSALSATAITLSGNSLISTNTVNTVNTFSGTIATDIASNEITGTGTNFSTQLLVGMPLHFADATLIGYVTTITNTTLLNVDMNVVSTTSAVRYVTSAIKIKRAPATISLGLTPSPLAFSITSITGANSVVSVIRVITLTGDNHDGPVTVRINPAVTSSGYMFEVNAGTVDAASFVGGIFQTTLSVSGNGQLNNTITIRYNPNNVVDLSLPGVNVLAAHSTELEVLRTGRTSVSTDDPRGTIAVNLRGNAQAGQAGSTTPFISSTQGDLISDLAPFTTYKSVVSQSQTFRVRFARIFNDVSIVSPANFFIRVLGTPTWANTLTLTQTGNSLDQTIEVAYLSSNAGSANGAIQVSTPAVATLSINVSGTAIDYASFININTPGAVSAITLTGAANMASVTVNGTYLTMPVTVTAPAGFTIKNGTQTGTSFVLSPTPADFGSVANTVFVIEALSVTGNGSFAATSGSTSASIMVFKTTTTTSINATEFIASIQAILYPNPTTSDVNLDLGDASATVAIYTANGTLVRTLDVNAKATIEGLQSGIYYVRISANGYVKTIKLVVI